MPDSDNNLFATGLSRLNLYGHRYQSRIQPSPRDTLDQLQRKQFPDFNPDADVAYDLMRKRNPGRKLTPLKEMESNAWYRNFGNKSFPPRLGVPQGSPFEPFSYIGQGKAHVPKGLSIRAHTLGRPLVINREFEHAYDQSPNTPRSVEEIAPVLGDIVFGAESFRRQAGKPLTGKIQYGYKNQDVDWMRSQAAEHGYFDGESMTDLLRTPEGISYLKQAALGPEAYAASGEFDPLAPRDDLLPPTKPVQLPPYPVVIPQNVLDDPDEQRKQRMLKLIQKDAELYGPLFDKQANKKTFPIKNRPLPTVRDNDTFAEAGTFVGNSFTRGSGKTASAQEQARKNILQSGKYDVTGGRRGNPYLEAHERFRYPDQTYDTIIPRQQGKSIRDALKKYEDNPMGGYFTPTQSLFPYYRITPEIRANMRARHRGLPNGN